MYNECKPNYKNDLYPSEDLINFSLLISSTFLKEMIVLGANITPPRSDDSLAYTLLRISSPALCSSATRAIGTLSHTNNRWHTSCFRCPIEQRLLDLYKRPQIKRITLLIINTQVFLCQPIHINSQFSLMPKRNQGLPITEAYSVWCESVYPITCVMLCY